MALPGFLDLLAKASYLAAAALFILGLMKMASPVTARTGIRWAGVGMVIATLVTFVAPSTWGAHGIDTTNLVLMVVAIALSWAFWAWGRKVPITDMPQMVAIFNGMGGGSAAAIGAYALLNAATFGGACTAEAIAAHACLDRTKLVLAILGSLIGAVAFSGSVIAWAKLDGRLDRTFRFAGQQLFNGLVFLASLGLGAFLVYQLQVPAIIAFFVVALLFGVLMTLPIGGADMPVVISLYNAFTGLAVAFKGYVLGNEALIIAGTVVGAAGMLLTQLMAKAMNRPISNVLFSNFGGGGQAQEIAGSQKEIEASDVAAMMAFAERVVIVPGYGMAVAQAQHKIWELSRLLIERGVKVRFAIHPVAGRMPGHMNVLLAEAGVPYDLIVDMDDINPEFATTDVSLVIGANDVVNPVARTDPGSPIYGMPILDVDHSRNVVIVKRGKGRGFAGIENALFYADNARLLYGDGNAVAGALVSELKQLET
ncbi:MAG: NAD(P)(+) transhydrogenase (Re/Si-specific) subunit beta [Pseudoxanthomonas sp.]|nr:NAD(P)(+) transhydrogenase (Re/Si-specific) subunit beta [Pseudoxanthomonas sp.]